MMNLSSAAMIVNGNLHGSEATFTSVSSDSRAVQPEGLFVAIPGENLDGHKYISQAGENGAVAAMVSEYSDQTLPQIEVKDTTIALGQLAASWRARFELPVIAITGSNGKTTVTNMVATVLRRSGSCLSPQKSFNNQWGVPLTLLGLSSDHKFAVIEMGTNHCGEINYLTRITNPNIALINNISLAHSEGLGNTDEIAEAKSEIFNGLTSPGIAVLNADDKYFESFESCLLERSEDVEVISFGTSSNADIMINSVRLSSSGSAFKLTYGNSEVEVELGLPGNHNVLNAAAAAAICLQCGLSLSEIGLGLQSVEGVQGRLNSLPGLNQSTVIDDSYNANPGSIKAAIDVLSTFSGTRILVLGVMAELGSDSTRLHEQVGEYARLAKIDELYCLGLNGNDDARGYISGFGTSSHLMSDVSEIVEMLKRDLNENTTVLVKGSRSSRTERIVEKIINDKSNELEAAS
jgi:UDP-N-acetylmuramoyl-tripeptide--D-alanyl-D-alanine ligase